MATDPDSGWWPILWFCVLAMGLGTGMVALVVAGVLPPGFALASAMSASAAGVLVTAAVDGRDGLRALLQPLLIWRVPPRYWLAALLLPVPAFLLGSLANGLFGGDRLSWRSLGLGIEVVPMAIAFLLVAGVGQEIGWSGFLVPRLQARLGALVAALARAGIVGLWHLPLMFLSRSQPAALSDLPYGGWIAGHGVALTLAAQVFLFLAPWSILQTWLLNRTRGSLLLASVLHASEIWVAYAMVRGGIDPGNLNNYWGYGVAMVVTAAGCWVLNAGSQLTAER